ncbi:A-kinase anchor protein 4 [Varanus komodoensis]|uniref:A-kinase anchor protein 4-like n=1 Tax=Varanus komodoensis TaxID=61221 RepID=UPI001CF7E1E8|nr:A-kinase anchor protein 4-like [Varanus komodoensis]KAF7242596.1 A-kinase anchor protein 4 [Varanus komodoensis]
MAQEIDWLQSQAGLCKVDLYSPNGQSDQDRKVICFVDVSSLNIKDNEKHRRNNNLPSPSLDLRNLEEKEVIVIKDNQRDNSTNTEGAVCLFKQGSSEEVNVVSWLSNDLQKYAVGFQHALTPSGPRKQAYELPAFDRMSQSSDTSFRGSGSQRGDDLSYYVNKLCSLVVQMAHKEMKDKFESSGRCIRQSINPRGSNGKIGDDYGKLSPKSSHDDPRKASLFYGEMSNQSNQNGYRQGADRQLERKQSGQDDGSVSKGLMVYANQVASDMMFSFMKTMKVQKGKHPPPACVVLKKVLLKHTRDVISDLIDSTMKNLHNVTGVLMTDSDFVNTVKKNLFNAGTQKSTEILEAMVKRLFKALAGDDRKSQSLAFTALKTGAHSDSRSQGLQFASLKSEMHGGRGNGQMRPLPSGSKGSDKHCSMDVYAKDLIVTALMLIQQHLLEKNKDQGLRETNTTSFGYVHDKAGGSKYGSRAGGRQDSHLESQKGDISSILLSIIQKVLREAGCADDSSSDRGYKQPPVVESRPQRALTKSAGGQDMYDNMEQINKQFIDQLVESVMKLCLLMANGSDSDGRYNGRPLGGGGSEVIVNNQNCNNSAQNKELQAVLQWLVASQFNVPNLTFMNEHDGELAKLPQLADKAAKKGYSVGDIVQEVMRYYEKQQMDAMSGHTPRSGLVDWLLVNL